MIEVIVLLLILIGIGFALGWYIHSKFKWGDKRKLLDAKWDKELSDLKSKYELQIQKSKANYEKAFTDLKHHYADELKDFLSEFKGKEKEIRRDSLGRSRRSLVGKFIERFVPFLPNIPYKPADMHFLGQPIDYIVFKGSSEDKIKEIIFLEVKTGESTLSTRERSLKKAVDDCQVSWRECRIDTDDDSVPDKEMDSGAETLTEMYEEMTERISRLGKTANQGSKPSGKTIEMKIPCSLCKKPQAIELTEEDVKGLRDGDCYEVECSDCQNVFEFDSGILESGKAYDKTAKNEAKRRKWAELEREVDRNL